MWITSIGPGPLSIARFIHPLERFAIQGFSANVGNTMTKAQVLEVTGNAYSVPEMGAILARLSVVVARAMNQEWAMPDCIQSKLPTPDLFEVQVVTLLREQIVCLSRALRAAQHAGAKSELSRLRLQAEEARMLSHIGRHAQRQSQHFGGSS